MNTPDDLPASHGGHMTPGQDEPVTAADIVDVIRLALGRIQLAASLAGKGLAAGARASRDEYVLDTEYAHVGWLWGETASRPWCDVPEPARAAQSPEIWGGGSKVGAEWFPVVPPQVKAHVGEIISGSWKRTFGDKTTVNFHDLDFFPHLSGSQWFPVVPGTTSGTWRWPPVSGSRSYRGNHWGATPGGQGRTALQSKITGTTQPGSWVWEPVNRDV